MRSRNFLITGIFCLFIMAFAVADAAAETVTVYGTVIDANGNPVQGADVTIVDNNYVTVAETLSDASGNFEFPGLELGTATFKALASYSDGNKTYSTPAVYALWHASSGTQYINESETQLPDYAPPPFSVMGSVTDANGAPLEGARVMMIDGNNKETQATRSDKDGSYEFVNVPKTAENFTIRVLFIKNNQSYKASSPDHYPESGVQTIGTIRLLDYVPSAVSQQVTVQTTEPALATAASAEPPLNETAFVVAGLIGLLALSAVYFILRRTG